MHLDSLYSESVNDLDFNNLSITANNWNIRDKWDNRDNWDNCQYKILRYQ